MRVKLVTGIISPTSCTYRARYLSELGTNFVFEVKHEEVRHRVVLSIEWSHGTNPIHFIQRVLVAQSSTTSIKSLPTTIII